MKKQVILSISFVLAGGLLLAGGETLTWNGVDGGAWDGTAQNWMDEAGRTCAWTNGAEAVFAG